MREQHKIAVIYVASGQEEREQILANEHGSREFEQFVSGLGWPVNLAQHKGYNGGLRGATGNIIHYTHTMFPQYSIHHLTGSSVYYASATQEVMFHVATRLPLEGTTKIQHLGNDEVHIVWTEHHRPYDINVVTKQVGA